MAECDEEDYMSDAFLAKCQDSRPGLLPARAAKQRHREKVHVQKCAQSKTKPRKVLEEERRTEGLEKALGAENKGFAMLQRMGYTPGMALGKNNGGRKEPIPLQVRPRREGLGKDVERKRKQQEMDAMRALMAKKRKRTEETQKLDYRSLKSKAMSDRQTELDLRNSQRVCETLDMDQGLAKPLEPYHWTPSTLAQLDKQQERLDDDVDSDASDEYRLPEPRGTSSDEEDGEGGEIDSEGAEQASAMEQLARLTSHLRTSYLYCVWCGTRFDDSLDLGKNCPGDTADVHEDL